MMRLVPTLMSIAWRVFLLLAVFNLLLLVLRPEVHLNFDAGTENRILAERYLYGATPAAVLIGSSLGHNIATFLPNNFTGMAFSGGSPITGAEIIRRGSLRPRVVVVETNVMERLRDQAMVDRIFDEPGFTLRRFVPSFRTESRPIVLATQLERLHPILHRSSFIGGFNAPGTQPGSIAAVARPSLAAEEDDPRLAAGLAVQLPYNSHFDTGQRRRIGTAVADLKSRVDQLRGRGICVLLTRLPIQASVDATPLERFQAEAVRQALPPSRYDWIDIANDGSYHTVDGLHMTYYSGARAAWIISERVRQVLDGRAPCGSRR